MANEALRVTIEGQGRQTRTARRAGIRQATVASVVRSGVDGPLRTVRVFSGGSVWVGAGGSTRAVGSVTGGGVSFAPNSGLNRTQQRAVESTVQRAGLAFPGAVAAVPAGGRDVAAGASAAAGSGSKTVKIAAPSASSRSGGRSEGS